MNNKERKFYGCSKEIATKKLELGGNIIACINTTSQGVIKERVNVTTIEKFNLISKEFKYFAWAVN